MSWDDYKEVSFNILIGKTFEVVTNNVDEVLFQTQDGELYKLYHSQSCCESVNVEEVIGDLTDLLGHPILMAEEVSNADEPSSYNPDYRPESLTWTFYKLATIKGSVTIRWLGTSNGYYGEGVDFVEIEK